MLGYTSDWGVLYATEIFRRFFTYCFYLGIAGSFLSFIPFFFFDLTAAKHKMYVEEIKERVKKADIAEIEKHKEAGTLGSLDPELLKKYGYEA